MLLSHLVRSYLRSFPFLSVMVGVCPECNLRGASAENELLYTSKPPIYRKPSKAGCQCCFGFFV